MDQQEKSNIQETVMEMLVYYKGHRVNLPYITDRVAHQMVGDNNPQMWAEIAAYAGIWIREQSKEGKIALIKGKGGGTCLPSENETFLACTGCGEKRWFETYLLKKEPYLCSTCKPPVYERISYSEPEAEHATVKDPASMTREEIEAEIARLLKKVELIKGARDLSSLIKGSGASRALVDSIRKNGVSSYDALMEMVSQEKVTSIPIKAESVEVINDCTCSACGNTKCSSNEKSCWKCGAGLHG